jgi:hypothetical protein
LNWCFHQHRYGANPANAFQKASGEKLIIYHPDDEVIPMQASMHYAVQHDQTIRLQVKPEFEQEASKWPPHIAPLYWHEAAVDRVMDFLLPFRSHATERVV